LISFEKWQKIPFPSLLFFLLCIWPIIDRGPPCRRSAFGPSSRASSCAAQQPAHVASLLRVSLPGGPRAGIPFLRPNPAGTRPPRFALESAHLCSTCTSSLGSTRRDCSLGLFSHHHLSSLGFLPLSATTKPPPFSNPNSRPPFS
jgi:hypothetical protein